MYISESDLVTRSKLTDLWMNFMLWVGNYSFNEFVWDLNNFCNTHTFLSTPWWDFFLYIFPISSVVLKFEVLTLFLNCLSNLSVIPIVVDMFVNSTPPPPPRPLFLLSNSQIILLYFLQNLPWKFKFDIYSKECNTLLLRFISRCSLL